MEPEFGNVALAKLLPARRVVAEPLSQLRARREILGPVIDRGRLLLDAAWPQPIDQDARAVLPCGRIVSALQPNVICKNPRAHRYRSDLVGVEGRVILAHLAVADTRA